MRVYYTDDPSQVTEAPTLVYSGESKRKAHQAAAKALGRESLRGLSQVPTELGICYYAPSSDDTQGSSVEVQP